MPHAMAALTEFIHHGPEHTGDMLMSQTLAAIQPEAREFVHGVTLTARTEAVRLVEGAQATIAAAAWHPHGLDSTEILAVAQRYIESGQLGNYIRAAELGQMVIGRYRIAPRVRPRRRSFPRFLYGMWRAAPMLALLLAWLIAGLAAFAVSFILRLSPGNVGTGFEIWAVGFLVLVGLQFVIKTARADRG